MTNDMKAAITTAAIISIGYIELILIDFLVATYGGQVMVIVWAACGVFFLWLAVRSWFNCG